MVPELFARVNVGKMHFRDGQGLHGPDRVVDCDGSMTVGAGVDDQPLGLGTGFLNQSTRTPSWLDWRKSTSN